MRKLKVQMHITVDGFVTKQNRELDWVTADWSDKLHKFAVENLEQVDCILLTFGKKADASFITYWDDTAKKPDDPYFEVAKKIASIPKIAISEDPIDLELPNTTIIKGKVIDEVKRLKKQKGKEIMVYGGVTFVSSLIENDLIDEFYFLLNPVTLGKGLSIFDGTGSELDLDLIESKPDKCGIVVNKYIKKKK